MRCGEDDDARLTCMWRAPQNVYVHTLESPPVGEFHPCNRDRALPHLLQIFGADHRTLVRLRNVRETTNVSAPRPTSVVVKGGVPTPVAEEWGGGGGACRGLVAPSSRTARCAIKKSSRQTLGNIRDSCGAYCSRPSSNRVGRYCVLHTVAQFVPTIECRDNINCVLFVTHSALASVCFGSSASILAVPWGRRHKGLHSSNNSNSSDSSDSSNSNARNFHTRFLSG